MSSRKGIQKDDRKGDKTLRMIFWERRVEDKRGNKNVEELKRGKAMKNNVGESFKESRYSR